jgi:hypothetical protein
MMLGAIHPCAGEPTFQHAQLVDLSDIKLLPSVGRTALALAADLKTEQGLDAMPDSVVVRLHDSGPSSLVDKLDETLVNDRAHEIVIHYFTVSVEQREARFEPPAIRWEPSDQASELCGFS